MINIATSQQIPEKKNKPEAKIPKPEEKDDIVVPKKKIIKRRIIKKPKQKKIIKPLPKIEPTLEDKLKKLEADDPKPEQKKEPVKNQPVSKKKLLTPEESVN